MEITGTVFIGIMFVFGLVLLGYCCLRFCASEEKYIDSRVSCTSCREDRQVTPLQQSGKDTQFPILEKTTQINVHEVSPPPPGFVDAVPRCPSEPCMGSSISMITALATAPVCRYPIEQKDGLYPPEQNPPVRICPYPTEQNFHNQRENLSYSPQTTAYFAHFTNGTRNVASASLPPTYMQAMNEHQFSTGLSSDKRG